jgi:predicted kinase
MSAPTLHLISGLPCSGKTTYSTRLRDEHDAAYFSLDRWLITSHGHYPVSSIGHEEHVRRVYACRELIWQAGSELLRRGADVILDDGFFLRADRVHHIDLARDLGADATIHLLDTPPEVIRTRITARNDALGRYNFEIADDALEAYISLFEKPSEDEGAAVVVVDGRR